MPSLAGRLIPIVKVENQDYALLVPAQTALPATDLRRVVANVADARARILAALDYLFIGF
jgi:predicted component of type VI protein secretion system